MTNVHKTALQPIDVGKNVLVMQDRGGAIMHRLVVLACHLESLEKDIDDNRRRQYQQK